MIGNAPGAGAHPWASLLPHHADFPWLPSWPGPAKPSKWLIHFGEPTPTDDFPLGAADDPMLVFNLTDQVSRSSSRSAPPAFVKRPSAFG